MITTLFIKYLVCAGFVFVYAHVVLSSPEQLLKLYSGGSGLSKALTAALLFLFWPAVIIIGMGSVFTRPRLRTVLHLLILWAMVFGVAFYRPERPKDQSQWAPACAQPCQFTTFVYKAQAQPNDGSFETECRLLLQDDAFKRADCDKVFKSEDPMEEAAKIKCGNADNIDFAYWTNTEDEGLVVVCARQPQGRKI